jgi:hypothetical protein
MCARSNIVTFLGCTHHLTPLLVPEKSEATLVSPPGDASRSLRLSTTSKARIQRDILTAIK